MRRPTRTLLALLACTALVGAACSDDDEEAAPSETSEASSEATSESEGESESGTATGAAIDDERCATNEGAGTITYISSFDFAAATGILDVITADAEGYYDDVCLDVEIVPSFAPSNGAQVAEGVGQISASGSFGELVNNNVQGDLGLVAIAHYGKTAIEALVVPADSPIQELTDLPGTTMGIKGDIPYSIQTMIGQAGVERGSFEELILDGFDPVAHLELGIDSLPVYKSNEPNTLALAGVEIRTFDPLDFDVPSSFGVFFTSRSFLDENPTVVQDFLRASFRGFEQAVAEPETAVGYAFELINAAGNENFLAEDQELYRWTTESALVDDTTPSGEPRGLIDEAGFEEEIAALTDAGVFEEAPDIEGMYDPDIAAELFDGTELLFEERP